MDLQLQRLSYDLKDSLVILNKIDVQPMQKCYVKLIMNLIAKDQLTIEKDWLPISLGLQIPGNEDCLTHL